MRNKRKKIILAFAPSFAFSTLFLSTLSCEDMTTRLQKYANTLIEEIDIKVPLNKYAKDITTKDLNFVGFNKNDWEIDLENLNITKYDRNSVLFSFRLKHKTKNISSKIIKRIIKGFKLDPEEEIEDPTEEDKKNINKIALSINFNVNKNQKPSEVNKHNILPSNYDQSKYQFELMSISEIDNENGSLVIKYRLKDKEKNTYSTIISQKIIGFLSEKPQNINDIVETVNINYKGNKSSKLPSEITKDEIEFTNFNKEKYECIITDISNINDRRGTLSITYQLFSKDKSISSNKITRTLSGFKKTSNGEIIKSKVRLAHWNVCNYSDKSIDINPAKGKAIASIIYNQKYDVVGLTELDGLNVAPHIVNLLNEIEKKYNTKNVWKYYNGDYLNGPGNSSMQVARGDRAASFIYKENVVKPKPFKDGTMGKFYDGTYFENKFGSTGTYSKEYVRPPFCMRWESVLDGLKHIDFTFAISHFDGPGKVKSPNEQKVKVGSKTIGSYEANEAWNIKNMFKWLKEQTNGDDDLIFQGDTNIPYGSSNDLFGLKSGEKMVLDESFDNYSSLKTFVDNYSEPYDKIIHKSNLKWSNGKVYKLWNFPKENIFQWHQIKNLSEWEKWCYENSKDPGSNSYGIYGYVSDHCPISYDLELDSSDEK